MANQPPNQNQTGLVPNPFATAANITVSVPEEVSVQLVDATALSDYEMWLFLASLGFSAFIGFLVGTTQAAAADRPPYIWFTVVLGLMSVAFLVKALRIRSKMKKGVRRLKFRVGEVIPETE